MIEGDKVKIKITPNEDCEACMKDGYNCNGMIGEIIWVSGLTKPYGVDLEDGSNCSYDEDELELI